MPTNEWIFLYQLCQLALKPYSGIRPSIPKDTVIQWEEVIRLAIFHKVIPLLYKGILNWEGNAIVPISIKENLKRTVFRITRQNLFQSKSLLQILSLFQANQIKVIPYKGVLLSLEAYGSIAMRRSSDIDLLISYKDFEQVKALLLKEGFIENFVLPEPFEKNRIKYGCEYGFILRKEGQPQLNIDLHWFVGDKQQQLNLSYSDFIHFINKGNWVGLEAELLNPEGLFLSTCIHHSKEQWHRLSYLTDIAALLIKYQKDLDWKLLIKVSKQNKIENILYLGVSMAQNFIQVSLPPAIQQGINQKKVQTYQRKFTALLPRQYMTTTNQLQLSLDKMWFQFYLRKKIITKVKILFYNILIVILPNGRDIKGMKEDEISYWQIFFTKPFRLFSKFKET